MSEPMLNRALGFFKPSLLQRIENTRQQYAIQHSNVAFRGNSEVCDEDLTYSQAHVGGVNSIVVDPFEGRFLLSGGADSSIALWDLEQCTAPSTEKIWSYQPLITSSRSSSKHNFGVTHLSFYPFDSMAFLSSSYDHRVKVHDSETLKASASFDLDAVVYSHSLSPIASHLLVATATQYPTVRLIDLRSGASTHSLVGFSGAVLSVAWSPTREHILAGGGIDGTVRLWDIRKAAASIGFLDMTNSLGIPKDTAYEPGMRQHHPGVAHNGPVNGVLWTDDGRHIVTAGHDERVRIWSSQTGANTLVNFGPVIRNTLLSTLLPVLSPEILGETGKELMFYPGLNEILIFELFGGTLLKRLKIQPAFSSRKNTERSKGVPNINRRPNALSWRANTNELYSAHSDGTIRAWAPRTSEDAALDDESDAEGNENDDEKSKKRKREVLGDIYKDFARGSLGPPPFNIAS